MSEDKKKDGTEVTDFAALVPQRERQMPVQQDTVQRALGELKENMKRRNQNPFQKRNPTTSNPNRGRGVGVNTDMRNNQGDRPQGRPLQNNRNKPRNRSWTPARNDMGGAQQGSFQRGNALQSAPFRNSELPALWNTNPVVVKRAHPNVVEGATLKIIPIGGIHDVQKNMYVYETEKDIVVMDCGIGFADEDMPGVDFLIPDISYLADKKSKVRAIIITHGHDDHIGALPYIWPQLNCPIYASHITCGFIKTKMVERGLAVDQITDLDFEKGLKLGDFSYQFFHLSHSIPDTTGFVIDTPVGRIVHCADFKFDWTPVIGLPTDVQRIAQLSAEGVLLLLSDSLGAEKPGYTLSEMVVESQFESVVQKTVGKTLITTTSSNISRIQLAMNVAQKYNKKVAVSGRSMDQNIGVARTLGYLKYSDDLFVELDDIGKYEDHELLLLVAGSQGQVESALGRISHDEHKQIKLRQGDSVIFSTDPIPGNENQSNRLIDMLIAHGAEVYYTNIFHNLHVSGHAAQEELKLMLALVRPEYVMPIGGTERSTKKYADIAMNMGLSKSNVLLPNDGDILEFSVQKGVSIPHMNGHFETKDIMVDGMGIGDLTDVVIRDRQLMAEEGMLVIIVPVDRKKGVTESGVEIVSRGFVYMKESGDLINDISRLVEDILEEQKDKPFDWAFLRKKIEDRVSKFIFKEIKRKPMVLPVVFEV
jgi:ribonuclease J